MLEHEAGNDKVAVVDVDPSHDDIDEDDDDLSQEMESPASPTTDLSAAALVTTTSSSQEEQNVKKKTSESQIPVIPHSTGNSSGLVGLTTWTQANAQLAQPHPMMAASYYNQLPLIAATPPAHNITHNLIPLELQAAAMAATLHGTPGHPSALIPSSPYASTPALTVQERPLIPPVYNGVNPRYPGLRMLHANPPVYCVDHFLTPYECQFLMQAASDSFGPAPVVGRGAGEVSPSRTSSTCYLAREDLPDYLRKVSLLTGKPIEHCELPQVGRYLPSQQYLQHFDAFDMSNDDGRRFAANGGQRVVTVLVYLNDVLQGGATSFPALQLEVQPRQGMALVFFPATVDGLLDKAALHAALPAIDTKFVSQVWIRQGEYKGQPSKRLPQTMGIPFMPAPAVMGGYF